VEHAGAVAVIAVNADGNIILIKQFRKPVEEVLLEIPAGRIEPNENPEHTAIRELEEETGFKANKIKKLIEYYSSPGFSNEVLHIYLAEELELGVAKPDEDEYIEIFTVDLETALEKISSGEIKDSKSIVGILMYNGFYKNK
jgi:ADP-ribose pyrophosphatase